MTEHHPDALSAEECALAKRLDAPQLQPRRTDSAFAARVRAELSTRRQRRARLFTAWVSAAACAGALAFTAAPPQQGAPASELLALSLAALDEEALSLPSDDDTLAAFAAEPLAEEPGDADDDALFALTADIEDSLPFSPSDPLNVDAIGDDRLAALNTALTLALNTRSF